MHTLAFDIGGTKIAGAVCDENDEIVKRWRVATPADADAINNAMAKVYREATAEFDDIEHIGISAAGNVAADRRTVSFGANIPAWLNYPLADKLEALVDHKATVVVENDANCAGWGEFVHGAGQGSTNMVMLTIGTGLGGAIIINGELLRGSYGMAAELGHLPMVPNGVVCGCGLSGCAERYVSGTALEDFAKGAIRRNPATGKRLLELCGGDVDALEGHMVSQAVADGDEAAKYAFEMVGQWLGRTAAAISAVIDPDRYVIGGGVVAMGDVLLEPARATYVQYLQASAYRPHAVIVPAEAGGEAGLIGAANLARR